MRPKRNEWLCKRHLRSSEMRCEAFPAGIDLVIFPGMGRIGVILGLHHSSDRELDVPSEL